MAYMSKAIDEVRAKETQGLEPVLTRSRWLLLKRPENLTEKQGIKLAELLKNNSRTVKSYLLKVEGFNNKAKLTTKKAHS
uniref:Transposase n=1 Tax=Candidatus Kentrum sp. LFY TaxID=2126342 RepID=A0A450W932_9GAMM|nr:MAG: Transposase [Candidatus Kentron sp. LFY]